MAATTLSSRWSRMPFAQMFDGIGDIDGVGARAADGTMDDPGSLLDGDGASILGMGAIDYIG